MTFDSRLTFENHLRSVSRAARLAISRKSLGVFHDRLLLERKLSWFEQVPPLRGALAVPYVPARVTLGALVAHRYTYAPPRCRTSQCIMSSIPLSISLWNDLADPVLDGVGLADFKSKANALLLA